MDKEDKLMLPGLNDAQKSIIEQTTPARYIKQRSGRGGMTFSYVEVGYVIQVLNQAFGIGGWDWEIQEQQIGARQVWVKGKLTVHFSHEHRVVKSSFGGSDIKLSKTNNESVDIGDDLKAASADALKKAASMIGVAADVYFPQLDRLD